MTKSLMTATYNGDDGQYIELKDGGNEVRVGCQDSKKTRYNADDNKVLVRSEVRVETHDIV